MTLKGNQRGYEDELVRALKRDAVRPTPITTG